MPVFFFGSQIHKLRWISLKIQGFYGFTLFHPLAHLHFPIKTHLLGGAMPSEKHHQSTPANSNGWPSWDDTSNGCHLGNGCHGKSNQHQNENP